MMTLPTVDYLKKHALKIHYFGLGFLQINVSASARYNFYHKDVPAFVDSPHDHRYDFISTILKGSLQNDIWVPSSSGTLRGFLENESCREGVPPSGEPIPVLLGLAGTFQSIPTARYRLHCDTLHTVLPLSLEIGPTITYVERDSIVKEYARVFRHEGERKICPFSRKMPEDDMWAIVAECLRE